jgi:hypothetical protein
MLESLMLWLPQRLYQLVPVWSTLHSKDPNKVVTSKFDPKMHNLRIHLKRLENAPNISNWMKINKKGERKGVANMAKATKELRKHILQPFCC